MDFKNFRTILFVTIFLSFISCKDETKDSKINSETCFRDLVKAFKSEDHNNIFSFIEPGEILITWGSSDMVFDTTKKLSKEEEAILNGLIFNENLLPLKLKETDLSSFARAIKDSNETQSCLAKPCNNQDNYFLKVNYRFHTYTAYFDLQKDNDCKIIFFTIIPD
ncbi:hypothetical protein [Leptospira meyeri]|uniref:hypothetical protein n=1 Tax=Leptospira meyeri TaxID=29508 RepID=UPI0010847D89|nr:hypothetical protein [Leptospira meyeri]TGL11234.1 hypothetical protein EHQ50_15975 [Leptospira meyeri]